MNRKYVKITFKTESKARCMITDFLGTTSETIAFDFCACILKGSFCNILMAPTAQTDKIVC